LEIADEICRLRFSSLSGRISGPGLTGCTVVMPGNIAGSRKFMTFPARKIFPNTDVNVMVPYRPPLGQTCRDEWINRRITVAEPVVAVEAALRLGFIAWVEGE